MFDTYLASQLISAGDQDRRHSLADVTQFFTGVELDKSMQLSDWSADELSQSQVEYAARDAAIMPQLREQVADRLKADGLENVAALEFECVVPIAEMELNGFYLDEARWREQLEKVKIAQAKAADELQDLLSSGVAQASLFGRAEINLDSQPQVTDALVNLGVPVPDTTRAMAASAASCGISCRCQTARISRRREVADQLWREHSGIHRTDNRTHPCRFSPDRRSDRPLFMLESESAADTARGQEYRRCFIAPEGRKLVIADYSQIELRILAEFSDDENFIKAFVSGAGFSRVGGGQVFGVKPEEVTDEQRSFAKRLNFGIVYGIGASRFGADDRPFANRCRKHDAAIFRHLSASRRIPSRSGRRIVDERSARTASGRMLRLRFDENDRQQVASSKRYGINMPIQGTSADILKRALRLLHEKIRGTSANLVNIVHDEIIVECDAADAEQTARPVRRARCAPPARNTSKRYR